MDISQFSKREKEVVELLLQGKSNKQIALALGVSQNTVEYHLKNIYKKLRVSSRTEAVLRLGKSVGGDALSKLGESVVDQPGESTENSRKIISRKDSHEKLYLHCCRKFAGGCAGLRVGLNNDAS